jgi:hypothetical protein
VAANISTPPSCLCILAKDESWLVRENVAENPNTSPSSLAVLAKDKKSLVRQAAIKNPNLPPCFKFKLDSHHSTRL